MPSLANQITANPVGGFIFRSAVQPALHLLRRLTSPSIPSDQTISTFQFNGQTHRIRRRRHGSGAQSITQCFTEQQYNFPVGVHGLLVQRLYDEIVASGRQPLIIDCGANIGSSVLWFSLRYPKAHIVAIEPAPDNFELLRVNTRSLDVDLREAGISPSDGTCYLDSERGTDMSYRTLAAGDGPAIRMISIDTILAGKSEIQYAPFLLKIDIEGAEQPLFAGDCTSINRFPLIILEPHDWLNPGQQVSANFLRFHLEYGRELCTRNENLASIVPDPSLAKATAGFWN